MQYLSIGRDNISKEKFRPVMDKNDGSSKPVHGFWFTEYDPRFPNYNVWVNYLLEHSEILYHKCNGIDMYNQPCLVATLNDDAKIYNLNDILTFNDLIKYYSRNQKDISYELLSHDFDGIFVDTKALLNIFEPSIIRLCMAYSVSTLLLFSPDCIDYYQSGTVILDRDSFDEFSLEYAEYEIVCDKTRKRVK